MNNGTVSAAAVSPAEEKKAARERKRAEWAAARAAEDEKLEDELFALEEKYESEGKRRGVDYQLHKTLVGNFAVRNPDFMVAKKFSEIPLEKKSVEDVIQFVDKCVLHPEVMTARTILQAHAGIAWDLAAAVLRLHSADATGRAGK